MTAFQLARSELKRMTAGVLPTVALIALTLVPLLYGALYLYANWDPYSKLDQLKAALVVNDRGAQGPDGSDLRVGEQVASTLLEGRKFDWLRVDSDQQADEGVAAGTYSFALKIPSGFSANLASPSNFDAAKQAMLQVTTNDANNYLLSSIVDKVTSEVHNSVSREVGETTANQLLTGYGTIHTQLARATDGSTKLAEGANLLRDGLNQLQPGTAQLRTGAESLETGQNQLLQGAQQLHGGLGELAGGQRQLADGTHRLAAGSTELRDGLRELQGRTSALPAATEQLAQGADHVAGGNETLNTKVHSVVAELEKFDRGAARTFDALLAKLVREGILSPQQRDSLSAAVQADIAPIRERIAGDTRDIQRLTDGSRAVAAGARQLAGASGALHAGIAAAGGGAERLSQGAQSLADGQQRAVEGVQQLDSGASALVAGQRRATEGSTQLAQGARALETGTEKLKGGGVDLAEGAGTLAEQLEKGTNAIPNPDDAQRARAASVMGDPVAVDTTSQAKAPTYGAGLAPFFLALALWIGAFLLVQVLKPLSVRALASNTAWWKVAFGGWFPFVLISLAQAIVLYSVVHFGLGLNPEYFWLTLGLLLLASVSFTALVHGIVSFFGGPGKFIVLILLVLQLVSSGGTFPWQTAPAPLRALHQLMPMSYVVDGLRDLIYGARLEALVPIGVTLLGFTALGLTLGVLGAYRNRMWKLSTLQPQISI